MWGSPGLGASPSPPDMQPAVSSTAPRWCWPRAKPPPVWSCCPAGWRAPTPDSSHRWSWEKQESCSEDPGYQLTSSYRLIMQTCWEILKYSSHPGARGCLMVWNKSWRTATHNYNKHFDYQTEFIVCRCWKRWIFLKYMQKSGARACVRVVTPPRASFLCAPSPRTVWCLRSGCGTACPRVRSRTSPEEIAGRPTGPEEHISKMDSVENRHTEI